VILKVKRLRKNNLITVGRSREIREIELEDSRLRLDCGEQVEDNLMDKTVQQGEPFIQRKRVFKS